MKVPLQPSKVQPSKKQTGLNLKQAKTVTKTVKPNYVLKATNSKQKSFLKAPSALFLYRMMGLRQTVLRRMEILDTIPGFFACC